MAYDFHGGWDKFTSPHSAMANDPIMDPFKETKDVN